MDKSQYRFNVVRPTRAVTSNNDFTGEIQFEFISTSDVMMDLQNSYLNINTTLVKPNDWVFGNGGSLVTDQAPAENEGLCQNPFGALFKSGSLFINDVDTSRVHQYGVESTLLKMTLENSDERETSGSPFVPVKYQDTDYDAAANNRLDNLSPIVLGAQVQTRNSFNIATHKRTYQCSADYRVEDLLTTGNGNLTVRLSMPLKPFFIQHSLDEPLHQCKVRLSLQVDPDFKTKIAITDSAITAFNITDINWNIPTFQSTIGPPLGITYSTRYLEGHSSVRANSSDSFQITMPSPSLKFIMIALAPTTPGLEVDNNHYSKSFLGTPITSMYVNFANRSYPSPQYNFVGGKDYRRAYEDYLVLTESRAQGVSPPMSYSEWLMTPVFVFICAPTPGNQSNILDVQIVGGDPNASVVVGAWYDKELAITYGDSGQVLDTTVSILNE